MKRLPRALPIAVAVAVLAVAAASWASGSAPAPSAPRPSASSDLTHARWEALPGLGRQSLRAGQASFAVVNDELFVAMASRSDDRQPEAIVLRLDGTRWQRVGGSLPIDKDSVVDAVGGSQLCLLTTWHGQGAVRCLDDAGRWQPLGPSIEGLGQNSQLSELKRINGQLVIVRDRLENAHESGVGVSGTQREDVLTFSAGEWRALGPPPFGNAKGVGSQRGTVVEAAGDLCLMADVIRRRRIPPIETRCWRDGRWAATVPPLRDAKRPYEVGAVTTFKDRLVVAVNRDDHQGIDWPIFELRGGRWRSLRLGVDDSKPDEQGTIAAWGNRLVALRVDQWQRGRSIRMRTGVFTDGPKRGGRRVGQWLGRPARQTYAINFDLATAGGNLYALYTKPSKRASDGGSVAVSVLEP